MKFEPLRTLLFGLIPPELPLNENGPPSKESTMEYRKAKRRWYQAVAAALWLLLLGSTFFVTWAIGLIPRTSGLAFAEDMQQQSTEVKQEISLVKSGLDTLIYDGLVQRLMENRRQQCAAIKAEDPARKATYAEIMQGLKRKYLQTQGSSWDEPGCEAL